jgi:hypothetical protein
MIIIEKIYVDNECSVIMLNSSAAPSMAQRHYGSRACRPLRELKMRKISKQRKMSGIIQINIPKFI